MQVGPRYKICKRLGNSVFEKCQTQKFALASERNRKSRSGRRGRPKTLSDYGRQLIEKQKIRYTYGISERQLLNMVKEAAARHGDTDTAGQLIHLLESRLDNVVYRAGLASTRRLARQIVTHGHITVNGRKMTIPSYRIREGEAFAVRDGSKGKPLFENRMKELLEYKTPQWMTFDPKVLSGKITGRPSWDITEISFDVAAVIEFYTR